MTRYPFSFITSICKLCLVVTGIGLLSVTNSSADALGEYTSLQKKIAPLIEKKLRDKNIAGLSLALVDGGSTVWAQGFGYVHANPDQKTTIHTQFRVGSITKLFTALATLQLQENELIDIDQPLSAYLERFLMKSRFSDERPITVRNVLTHHAGIPTDLLKGQWSSHDFTNVVEQLRNEYVSYPPEFVLSYSNVGYSLLGNMIVEAAHQPYESYIQENIAIPLNMPNTGFHLSNFNNTHSAGFDNSRHAKDLLPIRDLPALGLYSSASDLAKFITLFTDRNNPSNQKIISNESIDEMFQHQNTDIELDFDDKIGLAWLLDRCSIKNAGTIAEHGGTTMYYASQLMIATEHGLGVVVMANTQGSRSTVNQIAETILQAAIDLKSGDNLQQAMATSMNLSMPSAHADKASGGDYLTSLGLVSIDPMQGELCACAKEQVLDLVPMPGGWYNLEKKSPAQKSGTYDEQPRVTEITIGDQQVIVMHYEGRTKRFGSRMPEQGIPDLWKKRLGSYRVLNADAEFPVDHVCLLEKDERLYLGYRLPRLSGKDIHTPISPITNTEAVTVGLGRTRGETVQIDQFDDSDKEYLVFSGIIAEKVAD